MPGKIEKAYTDGAYNSTENQEYCQNNNIDLLLTAMQGAAPRYEVQLDENDTNTLKVTDTTTGETIEAQQVKTRKDPNQKKWKIKMFSEIRSTVSRSSRLHMCFIINEPK